MSGSGGRLIGFTVSMTSGSSGDGGSRHTGIANRYREILHRAADCASVFMEQQNEQIVATSIWSQRDSKLGKIRKFVKQFVVSGDANSPPTLTAKFAPVETSFTAQFKQPATEANPSSSPRTVQFFERYVEIWNESRLERVITTNDVHGDVFVDGVFGCHAFVGNRLLYTAAPVKKERKSTNEPAAAKVLEDGTNDEFEKVQDFGEKYAKKGSSRLFCLDLERGSVEKWSENLLDADVKELQYCRAANLICVVLRDAVKEELPMGMYYCFNRPSTLYIGNADDFMSKRGDISLEPVSQKEEDFNVLCARFSPPGDKILFVSNPNTAAHNMTMRLRCVHLGTNDSEATTSTVLDIPRAPDPWQYPGLYVGVKKPLLDQPFLDAEGRFLVLDTVWGSDNASLVVDLAEPETVIRLEPPTKGSMSIKAVQDSAVVYSMSSPSMPPQLCMARLAVGSTGVSGMESSLVLSEKLPEAKLKWSIQTFRTGNEIIYVRPEVSAGEKLPLLCFPHGGPHSAHLTMYSVLLELFASEGVAVILVNFRGSTGRGQDFMDALPGNCGIHDVHDCIQATDWAIDTGEIDKDRIGVIGGSHGGFLSAHLTGQRPDLYRVAVMRNPVVNIPTMVGGTEIPDWCYYESGLKKPANEVGRWPGVPTSEDLEKMLGASPISYVDQVTAPTLLQVGEKDLRVPPQQSMEWMRHLRRNGTKVRMLSYPDSDHSIDNSPAYDDAQEQSPDRREIKPTLEQATAEISGGF